MGPTRLGTRESIVTLLASFLLDRLLRLEARVSTRSELLLELVDSTRGVDVLQLAGVERMALAANVDTHLASASRRASREGISAATNDRRDLIIGVNAVFHGVFSLCLGRACWRGYSKIEPGNVSANPPRTQVLTERRLVQGERSYPMCVAAHLRWPGLCGKETPGVRGNLRKHGRPPDDSPNRALAENSDPTAPLNPHGTTKPLYASAIPGVAVACDFKPAV